MATPAPLTLSVPLTHSDWMLKPGMSWGEPGVRHMLDRCKAAGWTRVYWRVLDGGRSMYRSRLFDPMGKWDDDNFWHPGTAEGEAVFKQFYPKMTREQCAALLARVEALDYSAFDCLAAAVAYGHQIGLEVHAWVSINEDDHGWGLQSRFTKAHPEFRWVRRDGRRYYSQLSFAFPEVRQFKLDLLDELLSGYAIDGLFIDWIRTGDVRDDPQTDARGLADSGWEKPLVEGFQAEFGVDPHTLADDDDRWVRYRAQPQTVFMREARALLRRHRPTAPLAVMVGHPWHFRGMQNKIDGNLRGMLLDVEAWAGEGLMDAAVAAGYYRDGGNAELAYNALRGEVGPGVDVLTFGWVPGTLAEVESDCTLARKVGAKQILFWEADYIDDRKNAAELMAAMSREAGR